MVSPALWSRGIRRLDVVALSHAHSDHMGGLPAVLRNFHPGELWVGNNPPVDAYNALLREASGLHIQVRSLRAGDALSLGAAQVTSLPLWPAISRDPSRRTTIHWCCTWRMAETSVLLEGDAEAPVEAAMLNEPGLASTLLKVGHHGSVSSTRPEFLARVCAALGRHFMRPAQPLRPPAPRDPGGVAASESAHLQHGHQRRDVLPAGWQDCNRGSLVRRRSLNQNRMRRPKSNCRGWKKSVALTSSGFPNSVWPGFNPVRKLSVGSVPSPLPREM